MSKKRRKKKQGTVVKNKVAAQTPSTNKQASQKTQPKRTSAKQKRADAKAQATRMRRIRIGGFVALALIAIVALIAWRSAGRGDTEDLLAITEPNIDGLADAPVRVVEFGDFGCPACRSWHNAGIKEQLKATFGDQVSFEFRHFPVITAQSPKAAEAGQCAAEQGAFWAYHDYVYENTATNALSSSDLKSYATAVNLDSDAFSSCLDSGKYEPLVLRDWRAAQEAGARGTPTFYVNGEQTFPSYDGMAAAIQQALDS